MRTRERVEMLIRLAYRNGNPFEGRAAWEKAQALMVKAGLTRTDLSTDCYRMYLELAGQAGKKGDASAPRLWDHVCSVCGKAFRDGEMFAAFCSGACRASYENRRAPHQARRGVKRTHTVHQAGIVRTVEDKDWSDQTCSRCHATYHYMTYPGNPRRYCEKCRLYVTREYDKQRKREARALKAAQKAQA